MDSDELVEKIKETMKHLKIPGSAVGVLHGDETFTTGLEDPGRVTVGSPGCCEDTTCKTEST